MTHIRPGASVRFIGEEHPFPERPRIVGVVTSLFEEGGDTYATVDWKTWGGRKQQGVYWVGDLEVAAARDNRRPTANPGRLSAATIVVKVNAGHDRNGNPRRGWLVIDPISPERDPGFVEEGHQGYGALREAGIRDFREVPVQLHIDNATLRVLRQSFGLTRED